MTFARILSKKGGGGMFEALYMQSVKSNIANDCLERIGSKIGAAEIVETMDKSRITDTWLHNNS